MEVKMNIMRLIFALLLAAIVSGWHQVRRQAQAATTINVTTTADELNTDGDCSLREAVAAANYDVAVDACPAGSGNDTIQVPAGTYPIQSVNPGPPASHNPLQLIGNVTLQGAGAGSTILVGNTWTSLIGVPKPAYALVCDSTNDTVRRYRLDGSFYGTTVSAGSGGLDLPGQAIVDGDDLFVSGFSSGIDRYTLASGAHEADLVGTTASGNLFAPTDFLLSGGVIWATNYQPGATGGVYRFNQNTGAYLSQPVANGEGGLSIANSILFDPNGDLLVVDPTNDNVLRFSSGGVYEAVAIGSAGLDQPRGLYLDQSITPNKLYLTSQGNDKVVRYTWNSGAGTWSYDLDFIPAGSGGLDGPTEVTRGPDGHLYVISAGNSRILRFHGRTGQPLGTLVAAGGGLAFPSCITFAPSSEEPTATVRGLTLSTGRSGAVGVETGATAVIEDALIEDAFETIGAVYNAGTVTVNRTLFRDNLASAVFNTSGAQATVRNSTITGGRSQQVNFASGLTNDGGTLFVWETTLSGNFSNASGIVRNLGGTILMWHATVTDNELDGAVGDNGVVQVAGDVYLVNSLLAGNETTAAGIDCAGTLVSSGYNLIGNNQGCTITPLATDQIGTPGAPIDPRLGPLGDHGGPTPTHLPLFDSPALDRAKTTPSGFLSFHCDADDQRGQPRPIDGNGDGVAACDIGATEALVVILRLPVVMREP
jgi:CSLREA domain-containing protein